MDGQRVSNHSRVPSVNNGSINLIENQINSISNPILLLPNYSNSNSDLNSSWLYNDWINIGSIVIVGYQLWVIESNVTDREALLPYILVSTGKNSDTLNVERYIIKGSSTLPNSTLTEEQETIWLETKELFKHNGSRMTETPHGYIPLTSLPSLSPSLSIVLVPGGDYLAHLKQLYLNINLRRLGLGGRSGGLRLNDASPAQQLHFRQAFRLPIPPLSLNPSSSSQSTNSFADTVLELVALVQHALSLFGLGVVKVDMIEEEGMDYESTMEGESRWRLPEGDGLLCDTTLAGLSLFRVDIGEPFLRLAPDDSILSPPLLAALISLVISTRGKLIACGANSVPKDPFERRAKFLRACQSFQQTNSLPRTPYLTLPYLSTLSSTHARTRQSESISTTSKVSRALRHRLDASLALVVDPNSNSNSLGRQRGNLLSNGLGNGMDGEDEIESCDLDLLVDRFLGGGGGTGGGDKSIGGTVGRIWGTTAANKVKSSKSGKHTHGNSIDRHTSRLNSMTLAGGIGGGEGSGEGGWNSPTSESDSYVNNHHGFGRGVLKGVKERAGRAGRKFGDNLGFTDSHKSNAPAVVVSPDPTDNQSFAGDAESPSINFSSRLPQSLSDRSPKSRTALTRTNTSLSTTWDNISFGNSSAGESSTSILPPPSIGLGLPSIPGISTTRKNPRRVMSEVPTFDVGVEDLGEELDASYRFRHTGHRKKLKERKRRHSFNIMADAPEPLIIVSRKRLEMEVNLRMAVWNLRRKEKNLLEMVEALETVKNSYTEALNSLSSPYQTRLTRLATLQETSQSLLTACTTLSSSSLPQTPLNTLITNSSKLSYSQSLLEEKLKDVEGFKERLENKLGGGSGGMDLARVLKGKGGCSINRSRKGWWNFIFGSTGGIEATEEVSIK